MIASAAGFEVKGWCPGALRPMQSGDGLLVRIRPRGAALSRQEMQGIAEAAERHGNGHVDLTRRANLQIRGVAPETLAPLQGALNELGVLDATTEAESVRNLLVGPLSGLDPSENLDMRPLARDLADRLAAEPAALDLPAKFSIVLDGGGRLSLMPERADIRLFACRVGGRTMVAIGRSGTAWLGVEEPDHTASTVIAIIAGHAPKLQLGETLTAVREDTASARQPGLLDLGTGRFAVGVGVPFGRLEAGQLRALAGLAAEVRLSPWRMLYIPAATTGEAARIATEAAGLGFVTAPGDALMRIQACPGQPACRAAHADTRAEAARIAHWMTATGFPGTVHVSGCAKGCASSARSDITLVGEPGGYRLKRASAARDPGGTFLPAGVIPGGLDG